MDNNLNHDIFLTDIVETDTEYIPLLTAEDEKRINEEEIPEEVPIMTLRNAVLFPGVVIPITVGRDKSIKLIIFIKYFLDRKKLQMEFIQHFRMLQ